MKEIKLTVSCGGKALGSVDLDGETHLRILAAAYVNRCSVAHMMGIAVRFALYMDDNAPESKIPDLGMVDETEFYQVFAEMIEDFTPAKRKFTGEP